jgi:tetratricopeptide (TPR) repeat protein
MRQAAMVIAMLGMCAAVSGQDKGATQTPKAGQAQTAPAQPAGKRPPQAKTQEEFTAFNTAKALTDPAAEEKAADDFAAKYPDSELRVVLYKDVMHKYQQANNADKMMEMAQKALTYDPDDPESLLGVSEVLAERTRDTDLDKDQKLGEAKKDAEHALQTVDTDLPTAGVPPEQLTAYKGFLRSEAYAVLGTLASGAKNWPEAESDLRKSIDAFPQQLDAVAVFRLAVALDMQGKYPEGLKYANQAVDLTKDRPDSPVGKAARAEQDRLTRLNGGTAPGQNAAPPAQNANPPAGGTPQK